MKKTSEVDLVESLVASAVCALFIWYGWTTLANESVTTQIGIKGQMLSAHLSGTNALWYTGGVFLASAAVSYFAAKAGGLRRSISFFVATVVLLHPLAYVLAKHLR